MKKIVSLCMTFMMILGIIAATGSIASAATVVNTLGSSFMPSAGWVGGGTVTDSVLSIPSKTTAAQGRAIHFSNLDPNADWSGSSNTNTITAMKYHEHVVKLRMTLADIKEAGITSQLNLIGDANGYTASTYLVQLKSNSTDKFDVYIHDAASATNTSTGNVLGTKNAPATKVLGDVAAGEWVDVMVKIYNEGASVDYFINGVKAGTATFTGGTPRTATGLRFRVEKGTIEGTIAKYSDFAMTSVTVAGGKIGYALESVTYKNSKITMNFATEVLDDIKTGIQINGVSVASTDVTVLPGRKTVEVSFSGTLRNIVVAEGLYDVWGSVSTSIRQDFDIKRYSWVTYEDFENWTDTQSNWGSAGGTGKPTDGRYTIVTADDQNKSLKLSGEGMVRINKTVSSDAKELMETGTYNLVIKAKVSASANTTGGVAEISFASGATTGQKLFEYIYMADSQKMSPKVHGTQAFPTFSADRGKWIDVLICANVSGGTGVWNYYLNGTKVVADVPFTYTPDATINSIQFAKRNSTEALFDNLEVYVTDALPVFEVTNVETDNDEVTLSFSSEITNEIKDYIWWNGKNVAPSRLKIDDTKTKLTFTAPNYEYIYGYSYPLRIEAGVQSALGSYLADDYTCTVDSLGTQNNEDIQVYLANDLQYKDNKYTVDFNTVNKTGSAKTVSAILASYSNGVLSQVEILPLDIAAANGVVTKTLNFTKEFNTKQVKVFVMDTDTMKPYFRLLGINFAIIEEEPDL